MKVVSSGPQAPMRTSQAFETRALRRTSNISHLHPHGEQQNATPSRVSSHCLSTCRSLMSARLSNVIRPYEALRGSGRRTLLVRGLHVDGAPCASQLVPANTPRWFDSCYRFAACVKLLLVVSTRPCHIHIHPSLR